MSGHIVRLRSKRLMKLVDCQADLSLPEVCGAEIISRCGELRIDLQCYFVIANARFRATGPIVNESQQVKSFRIFVVNLRGFGKLFLCRAKVTPF